jgi:outer membrane protein
VRMTLDGQVLALLVCASLATCGCSTIRTAREIQRGDRVRPGERTLTAAKAGITSNTVISLETAGLLALQYNPAVFQASQNVEIAIAQTTQARAGYAPALNASAGYSRQTQNTSGQPESSASKSSYSGSLQLSWLLLDFGKTPAMVRQAVQALVAAEEGFRSARNDTVLAVRTAFYNLWKAQELRQVAEEAVVQYQTHLDQVNAFAEVGTRTRYDVTKSEVDLGNARLNLITASNAVSDARSVLNNSLGLAENPNYQVSPPRPVEFSGELDAMMTATKEKNPSLRALHAQELVAMAAVDAAIADVYPQLGLQAQYGGNGSQFPLIWNWSGAINAGLNIFSGGQKMAAIRQSAAQLGIARANYAGKEQQIYMALSQSLNQLNAARQKLDLAGLIVQQAQESVDIVSVQYQVGSASAVDVTDAQVALTSAKANQVNARYDYLTAVAQIHHYIGDER